jgi:uncharacterized protein (TIGR03663 family)
VSRRERWAWGALLLLALALRLWALGERPPHHDEAIHCDFTYQLLHNGSYRYDPAYHGPLLYYTTAVLFAVLGETTAVARLYSVLGGVLLVALPFAVRRRIGSGAAWWTGLLLALSPNLLYYSRFARSDVEVCLLTGAALVLFLAVRRHGWRPIPWIGAMAALHVAMIETFYVIVPLLIVAAWAVALRRGVWASVRRGFAWIDRYRIAIGTAILWFVVISVVMYTFFFEHPEDAAYPFKAISYWYQQHKLERVGGPWYYHLPRLALYEFLPLAAAAVWTWRRRRRLKEIEVFCLAWGVAAIGLFCYLGEKTPWLIVHQFFPFMPLAGAQLARTFRPGGARWAQGLAVAGLAATLWSSVASSYLYPAVTTSNPHAELMVYVQTTPEEQELANYGLALGRVPREGPVAAVDGEGSWPLSWQWKKIPVYWSQPEPNMHPALVVCDPDKEAATRERLGPGYSVRRMPLRAWWVEDVAGVKLSSVVRWFFTRRAWSPIGATDVLVFEAVSGRAGGGT